MESDFIEISGEDDSLLPLPKIPNNDVSTLSNTFFSCSPLHLPRSDRPVKPPLPSRTPVGDENREKLDSLSQRDGVNKENVNVSKPELQKLNMEPQQMKRKKKGGGYNLRKSLAWNRAFFTEEGVLDPLELSMISGDIGKSCGGTLSIIDEDRRESLSGDSENLVSLQDNLFKESASSVANEDSKSSGAFLPKNSPSAGVNVASTSAVKRKVLSANDINRSGSKRSGCPRPVASSSLKRPANLNTSKASTKESKVSKVPVPKPDASIISATTKSTILCTSSSKQNQIAQRAVNVQRNTGLKGSLNNSKSAQNNAKSGLASKSMAAKSSVKPAKRNVVSTVLKINSSSNLQHPLVTKANNGLKTNLAPKLPASGHSSNNVDGSSRKFEISLAQNVPCRAGSLQYAQPQNSKPSGLRMPSPSLSFFNQSKPSASHSLLQTNNQACNLQSNISNLRKFGALNTNNEGPIPAPGKIADMVNNVAPTAKLRPPRSITGSSVLSIFKLDSHEKMSSNLHKNDMQKMPKNLTPKSNSSDIFNQQKLRNPDNDFKQHAEPSKNEKISHVLDNEMKSNDKKLFLLSALSDQVMEDENNERVANFYPMSTDLSGAELENPDRASHVCPTMQVDGVSATRDMIDNKCIEEKISDSLIKNYGVFSESLYAKSCVPDVSEQSKEQADNKKPYTCQDGHISNKSQRSCINNDTLSKESGSFPEFQKYNNVLIADVNPDVQCCSVGQLESSHALIQSRNSEEAKDSVAGVDIFSTKSQVGDGEMQSVSRILSVGIINNILFSSELDNQHIMVVGDASKVVSDSGGSKSKGCSIPSSISPAVKVCSSDVVKTAECLHGDDPLPGSVDALLSCDIKLHDQTTSGESKLMNEDQITATVTTGDIQLSNVPESGNLNGCELENLRHVTSRHSAMVQSEVNDVAKTAECLLGDDALLGSVDAQFSCYTKLHCLTTSAESELMNEDQITAAASTGDVHLLNVTDSGDFSGCKLENLQHVTSQRNGMLQSEVNDVAKTTECLYGDDALPGSVAEFSYDIKLLGLTTGESEVMSEDQITAAVTTGDIQLSNVPDSGDFSGCELENFQHLQYQHSAMLQREVNDVAKTAECLHGDDGLATSIDAEFSYDIKLHGQTTGELEVINEDQITTAVTTDDIRLSNVPDSGDLSGCELENFQHVTSQHSGMVQSEVNDVAKTAECLYGDDALPGSVAEFSYDIKLYDLTTGESEVMSEDQITAAVTTGVIQLSNVPDSGDFSGCELENFLHLQSQHSAMLQSEVNDVAKTAECLHGDDGLATSIDAEFSYDIKLHGQTTGELGVINEDQITTAVTTGDIRLSNVPDSGDLTGCELENFQHLTSQHSTMEQLEVNDVIAAMQVNGGSDTNEHKGMEDKQYNISEDNHRSDSDLPPDTAYRQQSTSIVHNDGLTFMHIVNSQSEEGVELLFNKGVIFEKSRKLDIGNIADVSPDVKNSRGGSESSHVLFQHEHTEQTNEEIAGFDNTIKKSHIEDAQMLTVDENLSVHSCTCNLWPVKNKSSAFVDGVQEQSGVHTDPNPLSALGSPDSYAFCLNEKLTVNNLSSEESPESNVCVSAMEVESSSNVQTRGTPVLKNGGILEEQELEYPFEVSDSFDIKKSVETPICYTDSNFRHDDNEFNHAYSMEFDGSLEMSNDPTGVAKFCSSNEDQTLSSAQNIEVNILESDVLSEEVKRSNGSPNCKMLHGLEGDMYAVEDKDGSVVQDMIFNEYKIDVLPKEAETTTFQKIGGPNSDMKHQLEDTICATDDNEETKLIKSSWSDKKKNDLVIKPPPYAVPFSDEWLAALEAAGEEILTKKSGAVQNSPPEKSLPEPGPWSPVKRKNNQGIGPFDCTKYTNANVNIPPDSN